MYIDSHVHLEMPQFDTDRDEVIQRAQDAGIHMMLNIGSAEPATDSLRRAFDLVERHDFMYTSVGVHPHEAMQVTESYYETLVTAAAHPKVIAWGEIGLDYHYDNSPRDIQRQVFRRQIDLARSINRPVLIHTRAADEDTIAILRGAAAQGPLRGILHCFTGGEALARTAVEMGFLISFSGILTFKTAQDLRDIAARLPLDRVLIETDCPFLAPVPHRGQRNEPAFVIEVAKTLGQLHAVPAEEIARKSTENFRRLFGIT